MIKKMNIGKSIEMFNDSQKINIVKIIIFLWSEFLIGKEIK